jgi:hypothetical protein
MLQDVANGTDPEQAWQDAVNEMEQAVAAWKSMHPQWESASCK